MNERDKTKLGRRDFLRAMGAGAGLAATAAAPLATQAAAVTGVPASTLGASSPSSAVPPKTTLEARGIT